MLILIYNSAIYSKTKKKKRVKIKLTCDVCSTILTKDYFDERKVILYKINNFRDPDLVLHIFAYFCIPPTTLTLCILI